MSLLSIILTALGIPILSNGIILMVNNAANIGTYLTIGIGAVFLFVGLFFKLFKKLLLHPIMKLLSVIFCFALICACVISSFLYVYGNANTTTYKENYLVVLGCGLNGSEPSLMLINRLDTAVDYLEKNTDCTVIVSGGQGNGEDIPEAIAMADYLKNHGIDENRIICETESTSTTENFSFSDRLVDGGLASHSAVFITNDFHIFRANSLAKLQGLSLNHLSAPTALRSVIPSYLRENLALVKMIIFNK